MSLELGYLDLHHELNKCYWNEIVEDSKRECGPIERQLHILAKNLKLRKNAFSKTESRIIEYALVDYHPEVVALSSYLKDKSNYINDSELDVEKMSTDYLLLMALRDRKAVNSGYASYASMVLQLEEIEYQVLSDLLKSRLQVQIQEAKDLIQKYDLSLTHWYSGLRKISCNCELNHIKLIDSLMNMFPDVKNKLNINRNHVSRMGIAIEAGLDEVWINVHRVDTLFDMSVFFHQIGHGIAKALDQASGLSRIYSHFYEELTGVLIEKLMEKLLNEDAQACLKEIRCLQYTRFGIEAQFELDLWFSDTSPDDLFRAHYQKILENIDGSDHDILRNIGNTEPLYMYNYILADMVAEKIFDSCPDSIDEIAAYLRTSVFEKGQSNAWILNII